MSELEKNNLEKTVEYHGPLDDIKKELEASYFKPDWGIEFHEKIGEGGLGEVWKGYLIGKYDRQEIAIKVSKRFDLSSLRKEAHIAGQLKHDDIGKIFLYDENNGRGMIIMEYIRGNDLAKIVDRHKKLGLRMPQKFSAFIVWVCCEALKYAHKARVYDELGKEIIGVLHRDISPGNIIVNNNGYTKIVDFGIGILSSDLLNHNIREQIAGKIGFIAPEILEPELIKGEFIDQKVDIYSLGMVADYLARGKNPLIEKITDSQYKHEAVAESKDILKKGFIPLNEDALGIDEEYYKIVKKATEIDRKKRYCSAFEMKEDLKEYLYKEYGPDRDRLRLYIDLIYSPGIIRCLEDIKSKNNAEISLMLKNKIEEAKNLMPYMVRNGKLCLETVKGSGYETEEEGYLAIY